MTFSVNKHTNQQIKFSKSVWGLGCALSMLVVAFVCLLRCIYEVVLTTKREYGDIVAE